MNLNKFKLNIQREDPWINMSKYSNKFRTKMKFPHLPKKEYVKC